MTSTSSPTPDSPSRQDPPPSAWYRQVQYAVNFGDLSHLPAFLLAHPEPLDLDSFCLALRVGSANLVDFLLPHFSDRSPAALSAVLNSWRTRIAFREPSREAGDLSLDSHLSTLRSLLAAGFSPPLPFISHALFSSGVSFSRPPPSAQPIPGGSRWERLNSVQLFWIHHALPRLHLSTAHLKNLREDIFPELVKDTKLALDFFAALRSSPATVRLARYYFAKDFSPLLWCKFLAGHASANLSTPTFQLQYKLLAHQFPCPASFPYRPVASRGQLAPLEAVSPITFCAINHCANSLRAMIAMGHLPDLLADAARLAPLLQGKGSSSLAWCLPYLLPATTDLLATPSSASGSIPSLFSSLFSQPTVPVNQAVHQFLVTNLDALMVGSSLSFSTWFSQLLSSSNASRLPRSPTVELLDETYQPFARLPLADYLLQLRQENLRASLPPAPDSSPAPPRL